MTQVQTGLMLLRVWTEDGSSKPLRVDIRQTFDLARGFRGSLTLADIDLVLATVRTFLETGRGVGTAGSNGG